MRNKFGSTSTYASSQVPTEQQQTYTNHYGRKWVGKKRDFVKGPFVLASNHFRKSFSVKPCVWLRMENRISRNAFHLTVKIKALTRKSFYVSIFTSNHFRTQTRRERERERNNKERSRRSHQMASISPVSWIAVLRRSYRFRRS